VDELEYSTYIPSGMSVTDAKKLIAPDIEDLVQEFIRDMERDGDGLLAEGEVRAVSAWSLIYLGIMSDASISLMPTSNQTVLTSFHLPLSKMNVSTCRIYAITGFP
jgi:hypothetical protein